MMKWLAVGFGLFIFKLGDDKKCVGFRRCTSVLPANQPWLDSVCFIPGPGHGFLLGAFKTFGLRIYEC